MPILDVTIVGELPEPSSESLARQLADAAGAVMGNRKGAVWVTVHRVAAADFAESEGGPPPGVAPILVRVVRRLAPQGEALKAEIAALTTAIARVTGRPPAQVHLLFEASAAGRLAFGGKLLE